MLLFMYRKLVSMADCFIETMRPVKIRETDWRNVGRNFLTPSSALILSHMRDKVLTSKFTFDDNLTAAKSNQKKITVLKSD